MTAVPIPRTREEARGRLVFALDVPSVEQARALVDELAGSIVFYKVGLELFTRGGLVFASELARREDHRVFLDLKLHDIPQTVAAATAAVQGLGASLLTLHGPPSSVRAAAQARGDRTNLKLLGVTVLTSLSLDECRLEYGLAPGGTVTELVLARGRALVEAGCDGLVASAQEAAALRAALPEALLVTPGIRRPGDAVGDQARVATPREATSAGADYLVIGRPIRDAADRTVAVEALLDDAWAGFQAR